MIHDRKRELAKDEMTDLPETRVWPAGARLVSTSAFGTWEGCGYDGLVMSASLNRYFEGPQQWGDVVTWYEERLAELGWPAGVSADSASDTRWQMWKWDLETVDVIDRVIGPDHSMASVRPEWRGARLASELPPRWSAWSVTYRREPPPGKERPASFAPPSGDDQFDIGFRLHEQFVAREGHADVPTEYFEGGISLGTWVANMRYEQANFALKQEWVDRLAALPGWRWLSGNDFVLLENFAVREGHTRVPEDHLEEGRPLGIVVRDWREFHAKGGNWRLAPEVERRLEAIQGWEW